MAVSVKGAWLWRWRILLMTAECSYTRLLFIGYFNVAEGVNKMGEPVGILQLNAVDASRKVGHSSTICMLCYCAVLL